MAFRFTSFFLLILLSLQANAQSPVFRQGLLTLPVVDDGNRSWTYELELDPNSFPPTFIVTYTERNNSQLLISDPYFFDNFLVIPEITIKGVSYWVELRETGPDRFVLDNYNINETVRDTPFPIGNFNSNWERIPGDARDIGIGADGSIWVLGGNEYGYDFGFSNNIDFGLWTWDGYGWLEVPGSGIRLDVDPFGDPWVINSDNEIWHLNHGIWEPVGGYATDIGIGGDGSVWVLGTRESRGGFDVYRLGQFGWQHIEGSGVRIDVDPNGIPWVINHDDKIFRYVNHEWQRLPGLAKDIGIGADGTVWVIGSDEKSGGYGIYRWTGNGWSKINGSGRQISVGPYGDPWVVNRDGEIYHRY